MSNEFVVVVAALVGILSVARLTRLVTIDTYPPVVWVRTTWDKITHDGPWSDLVHCPYCIAPYAAVPVLAWGYLSDLHWSWWIFNGWLALAYAASVFVVRESNS